MDQIVASRRAFLAQAAATGSALSLGLARSGAAAAAADSSGPFVDVHTHIGRRGGSGRTLTALALLKWMDEHHVAKAMVLPLVSPESSAYLTLTDQVLDETKKHPDRLVPFCCIDPRTSYEGGRRGLRAMIKEYVDKGAKGFGEHKAGLQIDDPRMMALYEVCDELKLPVLFHMDAQRGLDVPGLPGLERVLKAWPKVNFIGHGPGFWASISGKVTAEELGKYPTGPVQPGGALDRLLDACPNLWADISANSGAGALSRDRAFSQQFLTRRADRVLFGSDILSLGQTIRQFDVLASIDLTPEVRAKIERQNAVKLLELTL
jgi:predicted TIM-barrel fold metal-dependent hydrolase